MAKVYLKRVKTGENEICSLSDGRKCYFYDKCGNENYSGISCNAKPFIYIQVPAPEVGE